MQTPHFTNISFVHYRRLLCRPSFFQSGTSVLAASDARFISEDGLSTPPPPPPHTHTHTHPHTLQHYLALTWQLRLTANMGEERKGDNTGQRSLARSRLGMETRTYRPVSHTAAPLWCPRLVIDLESLIRCPRKNLSSTNKTRRPRPPFNTGKKKEPLHRNDTDLKKWLNNRQNLDTFFFRIWSE